MNASYHKGHRRKGRDEALSINSLDEAMGKVGGEFPKDKPIAEIIFEFLMSVDLKRTDTFLDIGCGCFRVGHKIMRYLDVGNYHGMDGRAEIINAGIRYVLSKEALLKRPETTVSWKFEFGKFGVKFDVMLAQSVLTHIPEHEIRLLFKKVEEFLADGGRAFLTFKRGKRNDRDRYRWTQGDLKSFLEGTCLKFEFLTDWKEHPWGQRMFSLRR